METELSWNEFREWFIRRCIAIGCSDKTIRHYEMVISMWIRWHEGKVCSPATCNHVESFLADIRAKPVSKQTYLRAIKTMFNFAVQQGIREDNPARSIKISAGETIPKAVTPEHLAAVIKAIDMHKFTGLRNATIFLLAFDTGCRVSELLSLTVGDVIVGKRMLIVKGKGNKERIVFFGRLTERVIKRYLIEYGKRFPLNPQNPLFLTDDGRPITNKDTVKLIWHRAQRKAGVKIMPFHGLRHGFARMWLLSGGDLFSLQQLLGHSDISVTKRYVKFLAEDLEKMHEKFSPVDNMVTRFGLLKI